jgi:hypothetical protein
MDVGGTASEAILARLEAGLDSGRVGLIAAPPGLGKSALLVQIGLRALLAGRRVLHVTLGDSVSRVRRHYDEMFRATVQANAGQKAEMRVGAERRRMIYSYANRDFELSKLDSSVRMLAEIAEFHPDLLLIDGFRDEDWRTHLDGLHELAEGRSVLLWMSCQDADAWSRETHPWDRCPVVLTVQPDVRAVRVVLHQLDGGHDLGVRFDAATMLALDTEEADGVDAYRADSCTLFSGGANGAEAMFGEVAARFGMAEVNFTFEGHRQARTSGCVELSASDLKAGDVSLVYVSRRLNRVYTEGSLIRRVLQLLWHMVSRAEQVFVVGRIQDDGTVVGGTGWSVELARIWDKDLWVFDQQAERWFHWSGEAWVEASPKLWSQSIAGTGTRYLNDSGRQAIEALFADAFSAT